MGTSEHAKELLFLSVSSVFVMRQQRRTHIPSSCLQRTSEVSRCFQEGRGRELTCVLKDPRVLTQDLCLTERLQRSQVLDLRCIHQPGRKEGSTKLICKQVISWFCLCPKDFNFLRHTLYQISSNFDVFAFQPSELNSLNI